MIQVFLESFAAGIGERVFSLGHAAFEAFGAGDVARFFQLAGVYAQVAVGGAQEFLEIVEGKRSVRGERAHDAQAHALMNEPVEIRGRRRRFRGSPLPRAFC